MTLSSCGAVVRSRTCAGDTVAVQVGHNDKRTPASAFRDNLTRMVRDVRAAPRCW